MNRKTGHTSYAYFQKDKEVHSLGFTHQSEDKASKRKLRHNVNPEDSRNCYVKTDVEIQKHNTYRKKPEYSKYRIHKEDMPLISSVIKSNKKRRY